MALNKIYASTQELHRDRALSLITSPSSAPSSIQPGIPVVVGTRPAVSLTASGNATKTVTSGLPGGIDSVTYNNGGVGNSADPASATFAFDGTFEFAVTGATTSTANETAVYITTTGTLTLTANSNAPYGVVDYPVGYRRETARAAVKIGA